MFRSIFEMEVLSQAKIDDLDATRRSIERDATSSKPAPIVAGTRRRIGVALISAGAWIAGADASQIRTPAPAPPAA